MDVPKLQRSYNNCQLHHVKTSFITKSRGYDADAFRTSMKHDLCEQLCLLMVDCNDFQVKYIAYYVTRGILKNLQYSLTIKNMCTQTNRLYFNKNSFTNTNSSTFITIVSLTAQNKALLTN